jgi:phosphoribosylformimino-5-aminoimidazole carboxamide ribotide isomerase
MLIIPAIDIHKGKCVMLTQGKLDQETIYSNDPVFMAKMWCAKGAERLHLVDLDGAFCGVPQNWKVIEDIRKNVKCTIEFGGGVRNMKTLQRLIKIGIDRIILGTLVVYHPEVFKKAVDKHGEKIMVGIDISNGKVAIAGWKEVTKMKVVELMTKLESSGIKEIVVTDVKRDGTLKGPNIVGIKEIARSSKLEVIASGGIGSINDIYKVKQLEKYGVTGLIIGKALYNESIKFEDVIKIGKLS